MGLIQRSVLVGAVVLAWGLAMIALGFVVVAAFVYARLKRAGRGQ